MKVIRHSGSYLVYLARREKVLFFDLLKLYPLIPPGHFRLSKEGGLPKVEENQKLLDEALAEQRTARKQQLLALLAEPNRCEEMQGGFRLRFTEGEVEWLLQVLNDINVGCWLVIGSNDSIVDLAKLNAKTLPYLGAMKLSARFQAELVNALAKPSS